MRRAAKACDPEDADDEARAKAHACQTAPPLNGLRAFSTAALHAEIKRRRDARVRRGPILKCEDCQHFRLFEGSLSAQPPQDYKPCAFRHEMHFRMPEPDDGPADQNDDWGFYRPGCADREERL